jgi:peptidoglycan/xylan/chitin deacetylase (PgdA/CDA1 family)
MSAVPILTYHSLDESGSVISTPPAAFRAQMQAMARRGFRGIGLGALIDAWEGRAALPERPLVLTFDDAYRSVREHAAPVLAELGFRATVFAVAGQVGKTSDWPTQPGGIPRLPLCGWEDLRALAPVAEVGAHGYDHRPLPDGLGADALRREIVDSRRALEDGLGRPATLFAYPYGIAGAGARALVREEYRAACGVGMGTAAPGADRHLLPRIDAYYLRPAAAARAFGTRRGEVYLRLRALGRAVRGLFGAPAYAAAPDA